MLRGEEPPVCHGCFEAERAGLESKRQREARIYDLTEERARALTAGDGAIAPDLRYVELRLGNICNLKCRTCNPASSSKWHGDYAALEKRLPFLTDYGTARDFFWPESEAFWERLLEVTKNVSVLYLNGGEPMLIRRHWAYLQKLVDIGRAGSVTLEYSTNMTGVPEEAFAVWKHFGKVVIKASIDDLGERNRYLRHPTEWEVVLRTLAQLRAHGGVELMILQTVGAMNLYYLDEFLAWANAEKLHVAHNFVTDPAYLGPQALPLAVRRKILDKLRLPEFYSVPLRSLYGDGDHPELWTRFCAFTRELDALRGERFAAVFPELCALIGP
jgi:sulfatase maturation enzyme AslB (radical SAM superfamily)